MCPSLKQTEQNNMNKLTEKQKKSVKILIRLGDTPKLAIKTIRNQKSYSTEAYQRAYYS